MSLLVNLVEAPTHWLLSAHGDLESGECYKFRVTADRILASKAHAAVLDLSNIGRLDRAGLGVLVDISHEHTAAGRRLILVTSSAVDRLLCDARLQGIFTTAQTREDAIDLLEPPCQATRQGAFGAV
jgi:anti-anti-sigma factor